MSRAARSSKQPAGADRQEHQQETTAEHSGGPSWGLEVVRRSSITRLAELQVRRKLDGATVKRYREAMTAGAEFPPVRLARVRGTLYLVDGWHRIEAAGWHDDVMVDVLVADLPSIAAAGWEAAAANLAHGLHLKPSERRAVFKAYVGAGRHRTAQGGYKGYRDMAAELSYPHTTLRTWMEKDFSSVYRAIGEKRVGGINTKAGPTEAQKLEKINSKAAADALVDALACFEALQDPFNRGDLIERAGKMLERMKQAKHFFASTEF